METLEQLIRKLSYARIAQIFNMSVDVLSDDLIFGKDLDSSFEPSLFKDTELDKVHFDIEDVSNCSYDADFPKSLLPVSTLSDYCNLMFYCFENVDPEEVAEVLDKKKETEIWELVEIKESEIAQRMPENSKNNILTRIMYMSIGLVCMLLLCFLVLIVFSVDFVEYFCAMWYR